MGMPDGPFDKSTSPLQRGRTRPSAALQEAQDRSLSPLARGKTRPSAALQVPQVVESDTSSRLRPSRVLAHLTRGQSAEALTMGKQDTDRSMYFMGNIYVHAFCTFTLFG